jgi:hypothetical protein
MFTCALPAAVTVIQWDHRGTGKTLRRNGKVGSGQMTFDQRVSDAVEGSSNSLASTSAPTR